MKDRIRQIMEAQHMTQQTFARFIEVSPASLSSIFQGRTKPTLNIVESIKGKLTDINTDWLLFGKGRMYISEQGTRMAGDDEYGDRGSDVVLPVLDAPVASALSGDASSKDTNGSGALFGELALDFSDGARQTTARSRKDALVRNSNTGKVQTVTVKKTDKSTKGISEIRVFYDDNTFEVFVPQR